MNVMKKQIILFMGMIALNPICMAQFYHTEKVKLPLLEMEHPFFSKVLNTITNFESENCPYFDEKQYFIACSLIDSISITKKIVISSTNVDIILSLPIYGVFYINKHPFFIHESMSDFFKKTRKETSFKRKIINFDYIHQNDITIINTYTDDSQTKWTFLLKDNIFTLERMEGQCKEPGKSIHGKYKMYDIDIIEEPVDDLPIDK